MDGTVVTVRPATQIQRRRLLGVTRLIAALCFALG